MSRKDVLITSRRRGLLRSPHRFVNEWSANLAPAFFPPLKASPGFSHVYFFESTHLSTPSTPHNILYRRQSRKIARLLPLRRYYLRARSLIVIISMLKKKEKKRTTRHHSLENTYGQVSDTPFLLSRLTNDAVAEGWLVRGYRDARGEFNVKLIDRN